jgi:hypothetical protein
MSSRISLLKNSINFKRQKKLQKLKTGNSSYTDKKENKIFLIYKEIQKEAVAMSYVTNGLLIYDYLRISLYIRKPFLIYDFATAPI